MTATAELLNISASIEAQKVSGKIIYLFPGQGVEKAGMGETLYENSAIARGIFGQLKPELLGIMFNEPREDQSNALYDTANAQPATVAINLATYFAFLEANPSFKGRQPLAFLGHSTGQMSAIAAAGVVNIATALHMATKRGRLMKEVGEKEENKGGMLALLGVTLEKAKSLCSDTCEALREEGIWIANDNTIDQIVLSGRAPHIVYATAHAEKVGIKKAIQLRVPIAGHCPLMKEAQDKFAEYLSHIKFEKPTSPIILNTSPEATWDPAKIKADLARGLTKGVRFRKALLEAQRNGVTSFVEIGKGPLSGFAQKVIPDSMQFQIAT